MKVSCYSYRSLSHTDIRKFSTKVQCVMEKDETWTPEVDDVDLEIDSSHFLTGMSACLPDENDCINLVPVRHGVENYWV